MITLNKEQSKLVGKAIRYIISDLQYERHQALKHGCTNGSYDEEIEQYKKLKEIFT